MNIPIAIENASVVPFAGTWIEMNVWHLERKQNTVVPLAGTWIEVYIILSSSNFILVVPLAGTRIEMSVLPWQTRWPMSRSFEESG